MQTNPYDQPREYIGRLLLDNKLLIEQRDQLLAALEDVWAWAHSDRDWTLDAAVWRQVEAAIAQAKEEMGT
jgi:hypothetical protein